jgi:hypothetical protein
MWKIPHHKSVPKSQGLFGTDSSLQTHLFQIGPRKKMTEHKYIEVDLMEFWEKLPEIPADHLFKGIPIEELARPWLAL